MGPMMGGCPGTQFLGQGAGKNPRDSPDMVIPMSDPTIDQVHIYETLRID